MMISSEPTHALLHGPRVGALSAVNGTGTVAAASVTAVSLCPVSPLPQPGAGCT